MATTVYECLRCSDYSTCWLFAFNNHLSRCKQLPLQFSCDNDLETYKCRHCSFEVFMKTVHHDHITSKNGCVEYVDEVSETINKEYKCERCNFNTLSKYFLGIHRTRLECWATVYNDTNIKCKVCNKTIKSRGGLKIHVESKHSGFVNLKTPWKCEYCSYVTTAKFWLKSHMIYKHTNRIHIKWFKCPQCSYQAKMERELKCHIRRRHSTNDKQYSCVHCPHKTKSKHSLQRHIKLIHDKYNKYKCPHCPFRTLSSYNLRIHTIIHLDPFEIDWFSCQLCPYKSKTKEGIKKHVSYRHTPTDQVEWYQCEQCSYKARLKGNLRSHMKIHDPLLAREFTCDKCPFKTYQRSWLKLHWQRSHGDNWIKCEHCDYKTRARGNFNAHYTRKHAKPESIIWHQCPYCDYKGKVKDNLKRHLKLHDVKK